MELLEVAFSLRTGPWCLLVDLILETVINDECWLVHVEVCGCSGLWRIRSLVSVRHLLLVEYLLALALEEAHMLLADVLTVKLDVWIAQAARHLLVSATRLLGSRTPISGLLLLDSQVSIVVSHLVLKGFLVVHKLLVFIQEALLQFVIRSRVCSWRLRCNLGMLKSFLSLTLRRNLCLMLSGAGLMLLLLRFFPEVLGLGSRMHLLAALVVLDLQLAKLVMNWHAVEG